MMRNGKLAGLSARNWLVLAIFFVAIFVNRISNQLFYLLFFALLAPLAAREAGDQLAQAENRRPAHVRLLLAAALWLAVSTALNWRVTPLWVLKYWYVALCWLFLAQLPARMDHEELRRQFFSLGVLVIVGVLPFFLVAMASVFTGRILHVPLIDNAVGIQKAYKPGSRIIVFMQYNVDGRFAVFCILFAIYGLVTRKSRLLKGFLGFDILVSLMVLAHTQSRSSAIALGICLGMLAARALFLKLGARRWKVLVAALALALVFFVTLRGVDALYKADVRVARALKADVKPNKTVEETIAKRKEIRSHADKGGQFGMFSNGRDKMWLNTLQFLKAHPRYLITGIGGTSEDSFAVVTRERQEIAQYNGYHNSYLATLAIGGVPLLLMMLAHLALLLPPCLRLFFSPSTEANRGLYIAPLFILMLVAVAIPEQIILARAGYANLFFYLMCGITLRADHLRG